jgi:heme/copper-type cytochrome/quinol oxidase subunit 1
LSDPRFLGFVGSAILTIAGALLGSAIRDANTMIPAHYHASIGAVTLSFMAITYVLLPLLGMELPAKGLRRFVPCQLCLFGGGQLLFALGFGLAGFHGLGRKAYASEQHVKTFGEYLGLGIMGIGGLIAILGGLLFLGVVVWAAASSRLRNKDTALRTYEST